MMHLATDRGMPTFSGFHGTTRHRAEFIEKDGFHGSEGRVVPGVYFWKSCFWVKHLAVGWYRYCLDIGRYATDPDKNCAVISAKIVVEDTSFIDFEREDLQYRIAQLAEQRNIKRTPGRYKEIYCFLISEFERATTIKIKAVQAKVDPPSDRYCPKYNKQLLGRPYSIIVLDNICIATIAVVRC